MIWRTTDPPPPPHPVRKQSRLPGHQLGEAEFAKGINSSTSPREPGQHMRVRSEMQNVSAAGGYAGSHTLGRGTRTRGHPLGESILPEDRTQRSPGEQGKTQDPWQGQARVSLPTQVWCCQWVRETKYTEYRVARAASL